MEGGEVPSRKSMLRVTGGWRCAGKGQILRWCFDDWG